MKTTKIRCMDWMPVLEGGIYSARKIRRLEDINLFAKRNADLFCGPEVDWDVELELGPTDFLVLSGRCGRHVGYMLIRGGAEPRCIGARSLRSLLSAAHHRCAVPDDWRHQMRRNVLRAYAFGLALFYLGRAPEVWGTSRD